MAKFRAKPVEVEAFQFLTEKQEPFPEWFLYAFTTEGRIVIRRDGKSLQVMVEHGLWVVANLGDWIVRGHEGILHVHSASYMEDYYDLLQPITDGV